jgi:hypothetical protein
MAKKVGGGKAKAAALKQKAPASLPKGDAAATRIQAAWRGHRVRGTDRRAVHVRERAQAREMELRGEEEDALRLEQWLKSAKPGQEITFDVVQQRRHALHKRCLALNAQRKYKVEHKTVVDHSGYLKNRNGRNTIRITMSDNTGSEEEKLALEAAEALKVPAAERTGHHQRQLMQWVASVDFFKNNVQGFTEAGEVGEAARREVIDALTVQEPAEGEAVITQGQPAEAMFVLLRGAIRVNINGVDSGVPGVSILGSVHVD